MDGPALPGLPQDEAGFIPIDDHARVTGVDDVYAAGDGTNFPIKQGGLGTQQADAAAAHIAQRLGALIAVEPFHPVLRGKLITGDESLHLRADVAGGGGVDEVSLDCLWWPPHKVSGRYLAPFLYHGPTRSRSLRGTRSTWRCRCRGSGMRSRRRSIPTALRHRLIPGPVPRQA